MNMVSQQDHGHGTVALRHDKLFKLLQHEDGPEEGVRRAKKGLTLPADEARRMIAAAHASLGYDFRDQQLRKALRRQTTWWSRGMFG